MDPTPQPGEVGQVGDGRAFVAGLVAVAVTLLYAWALARYVPRALEWWKRRRAAGAAQNGRSAPDRQAGGRP
jgi:hypothetical protein